MKQITIILPDAVADRICESDLLDLIEDGASRHATMNRRGLGWFQVHHSRLGVTIKTERL